MWVFRRNGRILFDEYLEIGDGPSTDEHPDDQPDKQNRYADGPTFVTTEPSSAVRAGMIRRVLSALHDGFPVDCYRVPMT